ncbi:STAS domain-containing protein [Alkalimarinus sediminis]|uniref:STAS domain-containing protein n=1 Tax=Alkalimarinus sediminis TaxID=1632866 RepID=A0A9E8HVU7_9ALTE|nr:STAS domain-containing protein [Alkalimarinus sediminis]UZW76754.1 STAS domain-containing protein [Alkalimarinus sediminis]
MADLVLESNCGIAQAEALSTQLEELFQKSAAATIDGSAVMRVDTAVLQLFASFFAAMEQTGVTVSWKDPSEVLCQSANTLGLKELLKL